MNTLGNILWFIFGGLFSGILWLLAGLIWCITIIGIPIGLQCFKFASLAMWPFGKEIVYGTGVQHLLHLKSKSKILRPIEIMGFFYEIFCQIQENNLL